MKNEVRKYGLSLNIWDSLNEIFRDFPQIESAILFGSRALGNFRPGSDVDIAIKGKNINLDHILTISLKVDGLYLPYRFDFVIYNRIKENALKNHIDKFGKNIYKTKDTKDLKV